ncbi:amino acid transporter [Periconia macrospinosa]|uniref:Amino acid transporter n=1 Tax=Periconia macrospinosa TaxID=97972 RepID=A0A2V1DRA0_9PLEO|nr:amino acid transporter [Periconia macrospinosa]
MEELKSEQVSNGVEVSGHGVELDPVPPQDSVPSQVLDRHINLSSIINFGLLVIVSWEAFAVTFQFALLNGGPATMVYGCILVGIGSTFVSLSLAELASIDPAVGAQYRWAAHLAPAAPRFWGLIQGWLTLFAWVAGLAAGPALMAETIMGMAAFNYPNYTPHPYQYTLLMWALIIVPFVFNLFFRKLLNPFELIGGLCHFLFFIVAIVTLAVLAERSTPQFVFQTLTEGLSGWSDPGVQWGIGLLTVTYAVTGFDGTLHMSDEVKRVRTRLPKSIIIASVSNSIMLFAFIICLLFCIGDINKVSTAPVPIIETFYQATKSVNATNFLVSMPIIVLFFTQFNAYASVSRLTWTFAKDKGLPFHRTFAYVHPTLRIPLNALALDCTIAFLLVTIYIGSSTAFEAIISLQGMALCVSYITPITFIAWRRIFGTAPPPGPFTLGPWGLLCNLLALVYLILVVIWMPFPTMLPVTGSNMNYAGPVLGFVILAALVDWMISGRKRFKVPVAPKIHE